MCANPDSLTEFVAGSITDDAPYIAVYLLGGNRAMLGLPENQHLGKLLRWAHEGDLFALAICYGPAALLAPDDENPFIYDG